MTPDMLREPLSRLRALGLAEAVSFLLLLGVAMPLKYWAGYPLAVRVVGWVHGALFMAYCWALFEAATERGWPWSKSAKYFVAALVPFGPFITDRALRDESSRARSPELG
jgi:integral membrane protein